MVSMRTIREESMAWSIGTAPAPEWLRYIAILCAAEKWKVVGAKLAKAVNRRFFTTRRSTADQ